MLHIAGLVFLCVGPKWRPVFRLAPGTMVLVLPCAVAFAGVRIGMEPCIAIVEMSCLNMRYVCFDFFIRQRSNLNSGKTVARMMHHTGDGHALLEILVGDLPLDCISSRPMCVCSSLRCWFNNKMSVISVMQVPCKQTNPTMPAQKVQLPKLEVQVVSCYTVTLPLVVSQIKPFPRGSVVFLLPVGCL